MPSLYIHRIRSISITEPVRLEGGTWTRTIEIIDDKEVSTSIVLFADTNEEQLIIQLETSECDQST